MFLLSRNVSEVLAPIIRDDLTPKNLHSHSGTDSGASSSQADQPSVGGAVVDTVDDATFAIVDGAGVHAASLVLLQYTPAILVGLLLFCLRVSQAVTE